MEGDIAKLLIHLSQISDWFRGKCKKEKYQIETKEFKLVIEKTEEPISVKNEKLRQFKNSIK